MQLTPDKLKWIWDMMNKTGTLFNDFTRGDAANFYDLITSNNSLWLEVKEQDEIVGIAYWTGMSDLIDADAHLVFFDRKPAEKTELCKEIIRWFFKHNPEFHRMSATLPEIYHATVRLAMRIGFKIEGRKRQSQLMGGKRIDEIMLGLLASELR